MSASLKEVNQIKTGLENSINNDVKRLLNKTVKQSKKDVESFGFPNVGNNFADDYKIMLYEHALTSSKKVSKIEDVSDMSDIDLMILKTELEGNNKRDSAYFANVIVSTNQRQIVDSYNEGLDVIQENDYTKDALPAIFAAILLRKFSGRAETIATTTTQTYVEGTRNEINNMRYINKMWQSIGDARTRPSHQAANGQIVPINEPFIVQGQSLRYPGDRGLGASLSNIIRCRCSVLYS